MSETETDKEVDRLQKELGDINIAADDARKEHKCLLEEMVYQARNEVQTPIPFATLHRIEEARAKVFSDEQAAVQIQKELDDLDGGIPF